MPWKRSESKQPYRPWNLQLLKAARERSSAVEPVSPEPTTPVTPTEHPLQYEAINQSMTPTTAQIDTMPNAPTFSVPTPVRTPELAPAPPTPIDELPPWVDTPQLQSRRDTVESIESEGSNWGAGPLVNDWSQFESQMKNGKETSSTASELPSETEISPSRSTDSTSQTLIGELGNVDDDAVLSPVTPSTRSQLDMSSMTVVQTSPARLRRSRQFQEEEEDDGLEWVTTETYRPEQNPPCLRRYSTDKLFGLNDYAASEIGFDAANRIDQQMQLRRMSTRSERERERGIRVIREVRQPPDDHSGGFSPGIPQPKRIRMLTVYEAL